jgi:protein crumbs
MYFFSCECPEGYKGRNCTEKEFCYWFVCPSGSQCVSLNDGHECVANATFNGLNSSVIVRPNNGGNLTSGTITATFR